MKCRIYIVFFALVKKSFPEVELLFFDDSVRRDRVITLLRLKTGNRKCVEL